MDDADLGLGQVRQIAAHVIEQDAKVVDSELVQPGQLARQGALSLGVEVAIDFEGA